MNLYYHKNYDIIAQVQNIVLEEYRVLTNLSLLQY